MDYIYCFCDSDNKKLRWLKRGYRHCFCFAAVNGGYVYSEDSFKGTRNGIISTDDLIEWINNNPEYVFVLKNNALQNKNISLQWAIPSCVSYVKTFSNFNSRAITPYGLFIDLIKNGGYIMGGSPKAPDNSAQLRQIEEEKMKLQEEATALAQEQTEDFRTKQRRGVKSLIETSESGTLG